ncbi:COG3650 family protein [Parasphingorhabdus sp.]|uniref:COG3650 family protein n=1 Tax=Parasphingorhabdus sp. TaxID=2709688 RepID=UPI00300389AA
MKKTIALSSLALLTLTACEEAAAPPVAEEKLGDYTALGTEPGWLVEIKGEEIAFTSQNGKEFKLPVERMKKTATGWEVRGFSDKDNINVHITSNKQCSDGMSDRSYADTVKVEASEVGTLNGCGGTVTEAAGSPP